MTFSKFEAPNVRKLVPCWRRIWKTTREYFVRRGEITSDVETFLQFDPVTCNIDRSGSSLFIFSETTGGNFVFNYRELRRTGSPVEDSPL